MHQCSRFKLLSRWLMAVFALCWLAAAGRAADPGVDLPVTSEAGDQKVGSVLIFPFYSSSATSPSQHNTRISITNQSTTATVSLHIFLVDGPSGSAGDRFLCLTPNQTAVFLTSNVDPGIRGFMIAIAVDQSGAPIQHNHLSGEAEVKLPTGHRASFKAEAVAAIIANPAIISGSNAILNFDGARYNRLSRALAADKLRSLADGNSTILTFCRVDGNYNAGIGSIGAISGTMFNDTPQNAAFTLTVGPQAFITLSDAFPITPVYSQFIAAGRTGWLQLWRNADAPLVGALLNFHPNPGASSSNFNGGHNLRKLTLTATGSMTIPIFQPTC